MKLITCIAVGAILLGSGVVDSSAVAQQPAPQSKVRECAIPTHNNKDIDQHPKILAKPEPKFTSEERQKFRRGVITLRAVLCGSGVVTDIEVKEGLAAALDEKAVQAAGKIQFVPAEQGGNKVSRFVTLKYIVR